MSEKGKDIKPELRQRAEQLADIGSVVQLDSLSQSDISNILHELQVHQIELELQNDELRDSQISIVESRDKYSQLYNFSPVGYLSLDESGIIKECNLKFCQMLGVDKRRVINYPLGFFIDDSEAYILKTLLHNRNDNPSEELHFSASDGKSLIGLLQLHQLRENAQGKETKWLAAVSDVTRIHDLNIELKVKSRAIDSTLEGVMIVDRDLKICFVNKAFCETTGYDPETAMGKKPSLLSSGKHSQMFYQEMWRSINNDGVWRGEIWNRKRNGDIYPEWLNISTITDNRGRPTHYVGVFSDITKEAELRNSLHELAYKDSVTGLPNRHLFMDRLEQQIIRSRREGSKFSLLYMDLDRFKVINDTLGHSTGDQLLIEVANRISELLRAADTIARMGGDEFIMLLPTVDSEKQASSVAQKILDRMSVPFNLGGRKYHVSISIGISRYPRNGIDAETLIKHADVAMYKAKEYGRDTYRLYQPDFNDKLNQSVDLERQLRQALQESGLELHYQPQFYLSSERISGLEALLR